MKNFTVLIIRIAAAIDILVFSTLRLVSFRGTVSSLVAYGYPRPSLILAVSLVIGLVGSLFLLVGYRVRMVSLLTSIFFIPTMSIFFSLYSGSTWGEYQWILQVIRLLEIPFLSVALFILLLEGPGAWSAEKILSRLRQGNEPVMDRSEPKKDRVVERSVLPDIGPAESQKVNRAPALKQSDLV